MAPALTGGAYYLIQHQDAEYVEIKERPLANLSSKVTKLSVEESLCSYMVILLFSDHICS